METSSCSAAHVVIDNHGIPHKYICPLTLEIMVHPLMDRSGRSYERSAILEWITKQNSTCPITRQPLYVKDLIPNHKLRKEIVQWRSEQYDDDLDVTTMTLLSDVSHDDGTIQIEEINRAIQLLQENYMNDNRSTSSTRRRHRVHPNPDHIHRQERTTASRLMRLFNRGN